jgi:hypothetical protein
MTRLNLYIADEIAEAARADAKRKGQPLSTWFERAAGLALASDLRAAAEAGTTAAKRKGAK